MTTQHDKVMTKKHWKDHKICNQETSINTLCKVFLQQSNDWYEVKKIIWKILRKKFGRKCLKLWLSGPTLLTWKCNPKCG